MGGVHDPIWRLRIFFKWVGEKPPTSKLENVSSSLEPQGQPFIISCFNWMISNLYIGNGCFTKHPFLTGALGFQEGVFNW